MQHPSATLRTTRCSHRLLAAAGLIFASPFAQAHHAMGGATPSTFIEGFLSGIAHPVIGLDHFAFLLVAALLSMGLRGSARYLVPASFVLATVLGTLYHLGAADLPMSEMVIALSALLGGLAVLFKRSLPALAMAGLFAVIGIFHGYAYGESIVGAEQTPLLSYLIGFALIQYTVIAGSVQLLGRLAQRSSRLQSIAVRGSAVMAAGTGAVFLALGLA